MRRRRAIKREVMPDPKYNSELVTKLIHTIMERGKKSVAQRIVYNTFEELGAIKKDIAPLELFIQAVENIKPKLEVKSRRIGGATYQVPVDISDDRQTALALKWLTTFAKNRKGVSMVKGLTAEILDAFQNVGSAIKKKEDMHKMAQANKAFAHFR